MPAEDMTRQEGERLAVLEQMMAQFDERLFGDGQPGEIEKMSQKIERLGDRILSLEKSHWRAVGGLAVIVTLANIIGALLVPLALRAMGVK